MTPHEHAQISYGTQWKAKLAKKFNALKPFVTIKNDCGGRYATVEQYGDVELEEKTARHENTPATELPTGRVFMFPKTFTGKLKFDEDDGWKLNKLGVPMPESAMRLIQAGERRMEEIIFAGMLGTATIGNGEDESFTTEALPATQEVIVNLTGSNTGLTSAKIKEGIRIFMDNNAWGQGVDENDILCLAATPKSLLNLWNEAVVTSSDFRAFAGGKPYDTGKLENFFGVKLMVTTGLASYKTGNIATIPMWVKSKVHFGDWKKSTTRVWVDEDTGGDRIRFKFTAGACREQKEGVVKIYADESV